MLDAELICSPFPRQLATGKRITVFDIISSAAMQTLNTGSRLDYENAIYEVMNRETVASPVVECIKFNCVRVADLF